MQRLVTLTGPIEDQYVDLTQSLNQFKGLSDIEAGLIVLDAIAVIYPDLTWNDFRPENWPLTKKLIHQEHESSKLAGKCGSCQMSGRCWNPANWAECSGNLVADVADVYVDSIDYIGDKSGDAIRLFTDEEVLDGMMKLGTAYMSGGQSELLGGILGGMGGSAKSDVNRAGMGGSVFQGIDNKYLIYGGLGLGGFLMLIMLMGTLKG